MPSPPRPDVRPNPSNRSRPTKPRRSVHATAQSAVVEDLDWSFIFWINVPIGVVCLALGLRFLGESPRRPRRMDAPGILAAASLCVLAMPRRTEPNA